MRLYGHVMRREDENSKKIIMTSEVNGLRSRGRQKKLWGDMIQQDMKSLRLKEEHTGDRMKWRRIQVALRSSSSLSSLRNPMQYLVGSSLLVHAPTTCGLLRGINSSRKEVYNRCLAVFCINVQLNFTFL